MSSSGLGNLSDPQTKEIIALFQFYDTDRDGLVSPRSATKLCEHLGFHLEPAHFSGDPGSTPLSLPDVLSWCNNFCGQCLRSDDLRLAQRFALLRNCDVFAGSQRISREALMQFLTLEQHSVRPEAVDALLSEVGTNDQLSKKDVASLMRVPRTTGGGTGRQAARGARTAAGGSALAAPR